MSDSPKPPETLEGERIILRARRLEQAPEMFALIERSRRHLNPWSPWEATTLTLADSQDYIKRTIGWWNKGETFDFAVFAKADGSMIGSFGLHSLDWDNQTCHFGFWIDASHQGRGLISEALRLGEAAAAELGFHRLMLTCDRLNTRSRHVATRNRYHLEARLIDHVIDRGQWRDTLQFVKWLPAGLPLGFEFNEERGKDQSLRLALLNGGTTAGWISGRAGQNGEFQLLAAEIQPEHRDRGLYGRLLDTLLERLRSEGFTRVISRQGLAPEAVPALVAKLKRGFQPRDTAESGGRTMVLVKNL